MESYMDPVVLFQLNYWPVFVISMDEFRNTVVFKTFVESVKFKIRVIVAVEAKLHKNQ